MQQIRELVAKFWKGSATSDERKRLLQLLRQQDTEIKTTNWIDFQKQTEEPNRHFLRSENRKKILGKIHKQLAVTAEADLDEAQPENTNSFAKRLFPIIRMAAAALIIVGLGAVIAVKQWQSAPTIETTATDGQTTVHQNKTSKILRVTLPDSSKIHLAPEASVEYGTDFNDSQRTLTLRGNARFAVKKDPTRPFRVTAKGYTVTALGTTFLINAADESRMQVRLLEGKIGISEASDPRVDQHVLYPGEELLIDIQHKRINKISATGLSAKASAQHAPHLEVAPNLQGQQKVVLHFSDTPVSTVIAQLEALYNKKIIYDDMQDRKKSYSGSLSLGDGTNMDSLRQTLQLLFKNNNVNYLIEPDRVVITKQEPQKQ